MKMKLRLAKPADAGAFVQIKNQLPLRMSDGRESRGGFLLGTNEATYARYISDSLCVVAEENNKVIGFGIIFPDAVLRATDVWERRQQASWNIELAVYEAQQLCYFEQFAFLPGYKCTAVALAYSLVKRAFDLGNQSLFTTTVHTPIRNLAAIPFIQAANGIFAGNINEHYPLVGNINSDIYIIEAASFYRQSKLHPLYPFLQAHEMNW